MREVKKPLAADLAIIPRARGARMLAAVRARNDLRRPIVLGVIRCARAGYGFQHLTRVRMWTLRLSVLSKNSLRDRGGFEL